MSGLELARFALYVDLGTAFGVPAAALLTRVRDPAARSLVTAANLVGLPLSVLAYLLTVAAMADSGLADLDWQLATELATTTSVGWAFVVRSAALVLALMLSLSAPALTRWRIFPSAMALASLAWSGHAAASEGALALPRLVADIVHLLAAAIWLGALVLFLALLRPSTRVPQAVAAPLERFAGVGSLLVALLVVTGLTNLWFLAPPESWFGLLNSAYGALLVVKLGLFAAMLVLAAVNRFVLVPVLAANASDRIRGRLRLAIAAEFCAALAIFLVVARLGLLDPGI